ncbi:TonB-dependent receptor [Flavilitoribacter nigricans DSM 23189 = NBRC 102662]|uniref:TonB-dependent receptor n=1 Tax=Flavilitoribacter nigricans (strain ATCC 23147 / DSM 23189 / NBRC 102662 / NCIMB 1420 / SS-2) TaxID=1122177 RepID=A0A2D0N0J9_FLAN2|nr:TonB-dependent receptor [Flavilitoribacter nigricans DSM 23189 = NBRC 102662]
MRHRQILWIISLLLISASGLLAQDFTQILRGRITDTDTGQPLVGASVQLLGTDLGTITDTEGIYRLDAVPVGRYRLQVSYVGFQPVIIPEIYLTSGKEEVRDVALSEQAADLDAIVVRAPRGDVYTTSPTVKTLTVEETLRFPATFFDPARLVTTFAGVVQDNDQGNGISIRGNSPNSLLWQLEGVDIVNPNHTPNAGTFSDRVTANGGGVNILSAQLLSTSYFYTGAFPANYGNALSGIMDMRLRPGNNQQYEFTGQAGLIGLELATEGPFGTDSQASYLVNYRYSFVGLLSLLGVDVGDEDISFQDLSFNLVFPGKKGSEFTLFGMGGISENNFIAERDSSLWEIRKDRYDIRFESRMGAIGSTYKTPVGERGLWHTAAAFSILESTRLGDRLDDNYEAIRLEDDVYDQSKLSVHSFYQYKANAANRLRLGVNATLHSYDILSQQNVGSVPVSGTGDGWLFQPYVNWQSKLSAGLTSNLGLHYSHFGFNGSNAVEPRASIEWAPSSGNRWSLSYGLHSQLQQPQLYFSSASDRNQDLDLSKAHHFVLGYRKSLNSGSQITTELFYQSIFNVPVSAQSSSFSALNLLEGFIDEALVNEGTGKNYGIELSWQQFVSNGFYYLFNATAYQSKYTGSDGIERDTRFNGNYIFNATAGKEWRRISKKGKDRLWGINFRIAYLGGYRDTPIDETASRTAGRTVYETDRAFSIQQKSYFRTDLRFYLKRNKADASRTLSLDIQNLTNAENTAYSYYDAQQNAVIVQHQLGLIPMLSYRVEF